MSQVFMIECAKCGEHIGAALEANGFYVAHAFTSEEDDSDAGALAGIKANAVSPAYIEHVGRDEADLIALYVEKYNGGEPVTLRKIGDIE